MENKSGEPDEVILVCEDAKFVCRKTNLTRVSLYFRAMFASKMMESVSSQVELKNDVDKETLGVLVKFAHSGELDLSPENACEVLKGACRFQFDDVADSCCKLLKSLLNIDNCLALWTLADTLGVTSLRVRAKSLALWEGQQILRQEESIQNLPKRLLNELVSHPGLRTGGEMHVFRAIVWWCSSNRACEDAKELMFQVRLSSLTDDERTAIGHEPYLHKHGEIELWVKKCLGNCSDGLEAPPRTIPTLFVGSDFHDFSSTDLPKDARLCVVWNVQSDFSLSELTIFKSSWVSLQGLVGYGACMLGSNIYVFGGKQSIQFGVCNRATWKYNIFEDEWLSVAPMPDERRHFLHAVCRGMLYVAAGFNKFRVIVQSMIRYDPEMDLWEERAPLPDFALFSCLVSHDDRLYYIYTQVYRYDSDLDAWEHIELNRNLLGVSCGVSCKGSIYVWENGVTLFKYDVGSNRIDELATVGVGDVRCTSIHDEDKLIAHLDEAYIVFNLAGQLLVPYQDIGFKVEKSFNIPWYKDL